MEAVLELIQCSWHLFASSGVLGSFALRLSGISKPLVVLVSHTHTTLETQTAHTAFRVAEQILWLESSPAGS